MNPVFISFEGIDGAGKSTHIARVAQMFEAQGRVVTLTREPGGTALAEQIRALVLSAPMDGMTEALLLFAARRDHIAQVIVPALAREEVVLCDRFTDATFAYQGAGRGFDWEMLATLEHWVQNGLHPDTTLWFDLPPATAAARLRQTRDSSDRFEAESQAFFEKVTQGYARRCAAQPQRFARIDASQSPEAVWAQVLDTLAARAGLRPTA